MTFYCKAGDICQNSEYLKKLFVSKKRSPIDLPDYDPLPFYLFFQWAHHPADPITFAYDQYSEEPWLSNATSAWVLADRLQASKFERYALSQFIQNCALMPVGPWEFIERETDIGSSIRRFSNHWVAWNCYLFGPGENEFSKLQAAVLVKALISDDTRDPRTFDLEHWYSDCGDDISAACNHDPLVRQKALEEGDRVNADVPTWGRSFEESRQPPITSTGTGPLRPSPGLTNSAPLPGRYGGGGGGSVSGGCGICSESNRCFTVTFARAT